MRIAIYGAAALFLFATLLSSPASAMPGAGGKAPRPADPAARFAAMDADKNGKVSWEEFTTARPNINRNAFDTIDADRDGSICLDEWKAFSSGHGGSKNVPDMGKMMKSMGGMGKKAAPVAPAGMPLIAPPAQSQPSGSALPLITPPAPGK